MKKRTILLGDYDTAAHGLWTLTDWAFPEPAVEENQVSVPGRVKGPLDLSTVLTDGEPSYGARPLTVTLESSEGDRLAREARISEMVNKLHGRRVDIVLPDHPLHYATGRLKIETLYNDMSHASVQVTGTCEPWLYAKDETVVQLQTTTEAQAVRLRNAGAMPVVPTLKVTADGVDSGDATTITLSGWEYGYVMADGTYSSGGTGYTSDYVQVTAGKTYTIVYPASITGVRFAIYDSDKNFLSRIIDGTAVYTATADGYIRVTTNNADGYADVYLSEAGANVILAYNTGSVALSAGTYTWPELLLHPGDHVITYSGAGTVTITYREAVIR